MERGELRRLLQATGCARESGERVFLCDPRWGERERTTLAAVLATAERDVSAVHEGWLGVPTGGTSGRLRFARHDERTLAAAVRGFVRHFGMTRVNAVDVLPPFHVSGLMARVRCAMTGGTHVAWDWKRLEQGERPVIGGGGWVLSLVPTQLQRLLDTPAAVEWLRGFRIIFLGGGPTWPALAEAAAAARLPLSLSYGMTETAAMVAALRPEEFLDGRRSVGAALPHARISLEGPDGLIAIEAESLFRGYHPDGEVRRLFVTEDLGEWDEHGGLRVLGRRDAVIITGGEKVQPADVEAALRASQAFVDVAVVGVPDPEWGEAVVACYPRTGAALKMKTVETALATLAAFQRPKRYVAIDRWPRTLHGKLDRRELQAEATRLTGGDPRGEGGR